MTTCHRRHLGSLQDGGKFVYRFDPITSETRSAFGSDRNPFGRWYRVPPTSRLVRDDSGTGSSVAHP